MTRWLHRRIVLDRIVAAVLCIALSPVVAVLALLVRRDRSGPVLIAVPRVGKDGRAFRMWKLRTMRADHSDGRAAGSALTVADDERITPIGRRLRSYHLDELPQLYNVARGDMMLLGPRPETPEYVDLASAVWQEVLRVRPGIAGPTQLLVNRWEQQLLGSRHDGQAYVEDILPVKLEIDRWYISTASPRRDAMVGLSLIGRFVHRPPRALARLVADEVQEAHSIDWYGDAGRLGEGARDCDAPRCSW
jgi:lipopolysaccharide/colanic/teichoic acid biosynthesis glycosyltransferase